jgi:hypothetical protein
MGWFDSVSDFFGGGDNLVGGILGVASVANTVLGNKANDKAADRVAAGYEAQAAAIREANEQAQRRFDETQRATSGANSYLRSVYASPATLNPAQRAELDELRRTTANRLATSGLRGAGRAQLAVQRGVEADFINRAITDNQRRADQAAAQHSSQNLSATQSQAGLDRATGIAAGDAALGTSYADAGADLASTGNTTRAISDLAGYMASEVKGRRSRQQAAMQGEE